jgi:hypothetical protein
MTDRLWLLVAVILLVVVPLVIAAVLFYLAGWL